MKKRRFGKGKFYTLWRNPVNSLTGLRTGGVPVGKRTATSNHFDEPVYLPVGTRVMFVKRNDHDYGQVLLPDGTLGQVSLGYLISED